MSTTAMNDPRELFHLAADGSDVLGFISPHPKIPDESVHGQPTPRIQPRPRRSDRQSGHVRGSWKSCEPRSDAGVCAVCRQFHADAALVRA